MFKIIPGKKDIGAQISCNIKKINKKLDIPSLKKNMILFLNWFSEYNIVPKGMALKLALLSVKPAKIFHDKFYEKYKNTCLKIISAGKESFKKGGTVISTEALSKMFNNYPILDFDKW